LTLYAHEDHANVQYHKREVKMLMEMKEKAFTREPTSISSGRITNWIFFIEKNV
jgi:hypothetical protein